MNGEFAFFINTESGAGISANKAKDAEESLFGLNVRSSTPTSSSELSRACSELKSSQTKAAVVFGGDGTHSYALRGLLESGIPLYPFPSGTANDLSTEQGITSSLDQLRDLVGKNSVKEFRVIGVNGIPFSTVAGIGIGSALCDEYNYLRNRFPLFKKLSQRVNCEIYSLLAIKQIFSNWGKGIKIRVKGDSFERDLVASSIMICNQSTLAGNLKVAPNQTNSDDEFTVLIHPEACGFSTLRGLAQLKSKSISQSFIRFKTKNLLLETLDHQSLKVFGDGEILTESNKLEFKEFPKKLRIFTGNC